MGWLRRQALAFFGQYGLQIGQRRTGARRHHQFTGLIAHDAVEWAGVQHLAVQRKAVKVLGAPAADAQGSVRGGSNVDTVNNLAKGEFHGLHGSGTAPRRTGRVA